MRETSKTTKWLCILAAFSYKEACIHMQAY